MAHHTRGGDNRQPDSKDRPCPTAPTNMAMALPSRCPRPVGSSWRRTSWAAPRNSFSCIRSWRNASVRIRRGPWSARFCFVEGPSIGQAARSVLAVASSSRARSLFEVRGRLGVDPTQGVLEPGPRIDVVESGGLNQGVDGRGALGTAVGTGGPPACLSDGASPPAALDPPARAAPRRNDPARRGGDAPGPARSAARCRRRRGPRR